MDLNKKSGSRMRYKDSFKVTGTIMESGRQQIFLCRSEPVMIKLRNSFFLSFCVHCYQEKRENRCFRLGMTLSL